MIELTKSNIRRRYSFENLLSGEYNGVFKPDGDYESDSRRIIVNAALGILHVINIKNGEYVVTCDLKDKVHSFSWANTFFTLTDDKVTITF